MRARGKAKGITVHAIAGTEVVLLGMDAGRAALKGLLGFQIERRHGNRSEWLYGGKTFAGEPAEGAPTDSRAYPIQAFLWGDYEADAGTTYTYIVTPKYGTPDAMRDGEPVSVTVTTERADGPHGVFFNRGVAGSAAYGRMFGRFRRYYLFENQGRRSWREFIRPADIPNRKAWVWLSRGLEEALLAFIARAEGPKYGLRVMAYELSYLPVLQALANGLESGADVKVIHHMKRSKRTTLSRNKPKEEMVPDEIGKAARAAIRQVGIVDFKNTRRWEDAFIERTRATISHNKFIVLLKEGKPVEVWTGSTNFTAGGIFGQSNVGHIVRDPEVAARYLEYWEKLAEDPPLKSAAPVQGLQDWNVARQADLDGPVPPNSTTVIFSPRPGTEMLQWYADRMAAARSSVHFTAAFGVSQQIGRTLMEPGPEGLLRYVLLENRPSERQSQSRKAKAASAGKPAPLDYYDFITEPANRVAWGDLDRRERETLSGLNTNVDFLHTKYLLIDPLTDDPLVIMGSANFSENSTIRNDENMLVIRGDTRLADVVLTEFMRLFNHFGHRNRKNQLSPDEVETFRRLRPDNSWTVPSFTEGTQLERERLLFR